MLRKSTSGLLGREASSSPHVLKYAPGASLPRVLLTAFWSVLVVLPIQLWRGLKSSFPQPEFVNRQLVDFPNAIPYELKCERA